MPKSPKFFKKMAFNRTILPILLLQDSSSFLSTTTIISLCVFFALLCACIIIGHLLEENRWANESITALFLGLCAGALVLLINRWQNTKLLNFSEDLFFLYLLPPIIFNAGFQVKKKQFFKNFTIILLFGILGTVISFCLISLGALLFFKKIVITSLTIQDFLAIGAILSATDSVCTLQVLSQDETPFLYSVVFGEGVVNDATSIVLYNAVQSLSANDIDASIAFKLLGNFLYLFFTSTALGIVVGLLSAYIIKTLYFGRHSTDREVALMMLMAYISYLVAELLNLSGILTIFFCGIVMSHYTWHNVTESSRITTNVGTSVAISSTMFAIVLAGRAAFVFPIANVRNCFKKRESTKIEFKQQFIMWWAGLMRGAVTIALSFNQVCGSVTKPLIQALLLKNKKPMVSDAADSPSLEDLKLLFLENDDPTEQENNQIAPKASRLRLLISNPTTTVHYFWRKFDDRFMRPVFGGRGFVPFVPSSPTGAADENTSG